MTITDVSEGKRNKDRVNVYIDGEFAFACCLETAVKQGIKKGAELSAEKIGDIRREDGERFALEVALKFVAAKPRTQKEIEDKLRQRGADEAGIAYAVPKLAEYGYINDTEYARQYAKELRARYGGRVVEAKLAQRGIDRETARALATGQESRDTLQEQLARLSRRYAGGDDPRKNKQKVIRGLMARGFSYDEIKNAMGGYEDED